MKRLVLRNMLVIAGLIFALATSIPANAQQPPLGAPFLRFTPDAHSLALGGSGVARGNDFHAQYYNASKYPFSQSQASLSAGYLPWLRGITNGMYLASVTGMYKLNDKQTISSGFRYFNMGSVELKSEQNISTGATHPKELAFDVAYARAFSPNWSMGLTIRYVLSDFTSPVSSGSLEKGQALVMDLSSFYIHEMQWKQAASISLGINISNLGQKMKYKQMEQEYYLPACLAMGVTFDYTLIRDNRLSFSLDANKPLVPNTQKSDKETTLAGAFRSFGNNGMQEVTYSMGVEYSHLDILQTRLGYHYQNPDVGQLRYCALGQSVTWDHLTLDATYMIPLATDFPLKYNFAFTISYAWK